MKQSLDGIKVVLLDIEGTVCPISFVKETLFPYALKALPSVLENEWTSTEFEPYKSAFPAQAQESPEAFLAHVEDLTKRDVKIAYLKNLQGYLWESGYKTSAYSTPLYPDVTPSIFAHPDNVIHQNDNRNRNREQQRQQRQQQSKTETAIVIYSSGSIFAQKLLFAHSNLPRHRRTTHNSNLDADIHTDINTDINVDADADADADVDVSTDTDVVDLTPQISAYFDTTTAGPKTNKSSYTAIFEVLSTASSAAAAVATAATVVVVDQQAEENKKMTKGKEDEEERKNKEEEEITMVKSGSNNPQRNAIVTSPHEILFFSDNVLEIKAALEAGLKAVVVDRPGNVPLSDHDRERYDVITSFDQISWR